MHYTFAFLALFLALQLAAAATDAQSAPRSVKAPVTKPPSKRATNTRQSKVVAAELEREQRFLRDVTSRFESVASHDITPLLRYSYVWSALRENRIKLASANTNLDPSQMKLFAASYDKLEKEVVATFGDRQLSILNDVLELNDQQFQDIQKAVEDDLSSRRDLLKMKSLPASDFASRVRKISAATEKAILGVLFPEQRRTFQKQLNFSHDRLVG
jgi:hypothetical protein